MNVFLEANKARINIITQRIKEAIALNTPDVDKLAPRDVLAIIEGLKNEIKNLSAERENLKSQLAEVIAEDSSPDNPKG